jgi:hypothetical protein
MTIRVTSIGTSTPVVLVQEQGTTPQNSADLKAGHPPMSLKFMTEQAQPQLPLSRPHHPSYIHLNFFTRVSLPCIALQCRSHHHP